MTREVSLYFLGADGDDNGGRPDNPPRAFILSPIIKTNVLGQSNVTDDWQEVGSVSEIPDEEPADFTVEFLDNPGLWRQEDRRGERGSARVGVHDQERHLALVEARGQVAGQAGVHRRRAGREPAPRLHGPEERGVSRSRAPAAGGQHQRPPTPAPTWGAPCAGS